MRIFVIIFILVGAFTCCKSDAREKLDKETMQQQVEIMGKILNDAIMHLPQEKIDIVQKRNKLAFDSLNVLTKDFNLKRITTEEYSKKYLDVTTQFIREQQSFIDNHMDSIREIKRLEYQQSNDN